MSQDLESYILVHTPGINPTAPCTSGRIQRFEVNQYVKDDGKQKQQFQIESDL